MGRKRIYPERECEYCGDPFFPRSADVRRGWGKYCSLVCANKAHAEDTAERNRHRRRPDLDGQACVLRWSKCRWCGKPFIRRNARVYCSDVCRDAAVYQQREVGRIQRHRKGKARRECVALGEAFTREEIFERDHWRCGLCGKRISKAYQWPDHRAPSIDHIVPLIRGGVHSKANVQASHLGCNWSKNGRGGLEQLRLFG